MLSEANDLAAALNFDLRFSFVTDDGRWSKSGDAVFVVFCTGVECIIRLQTYHCDAWHVGCTWRIRQFLNDLTKGRPCGCVVAGR